MSGQHCVQLDIEVQGEEEDGEASRVYHRLYLLNIGESLINALHLGLSGPFHLHGQST